MKPGKGTILRNCFLTFLLLSSPILWAQNYIEQLGPPQAGAKVVKGDCLNDNDDGYFIDGDIVEGSAHYLPNGDIGYKLKGGASGVIWTGYDPSPSWTPDDMIKEMHLRSRKILEEQNRPPTDEERLGVVATVGKQTKPFTQAANCVTIATFDLLPYSPGKSGLVLMGEAAEGMFGANAADAEDAAIQAEGALKTAGRDARGRFIANNQSIRNAAKKAAINAQKEAHAAKIGAKALKHAVRVVKVAEAVNDCLEEFH
jgi:hypothetical protein